MHLRVGLDSTYLIRAWFPCRQLQNLSEGLDIGLTTVNSSFQNWTLLSLEGHGFVPMADGRTLSHKMMTL